jgi:excisionase family DNA binding protein
MTKLSRKKQIARPSALLTKNELAAFLRVKKRVIENYVHDGTFPFIKIRAAVRFRLADVEKVLDRLTIHGARKDLDRKMRAATETEQSNERATDRQMKIGTD